MSPPGGCASDCIFCAILADRAPASFLAREDEVAAFLDLYPVNRGHALVVPRAHAVGLADLDPATGGRLMALAQRTAAALRAALPGTAGINLHLADGAAAGQEVFHVHLHVIPRAPGDGFGLRMPPGYGRAAERGALDELAADLHGRLDGR